MEAHFIPLPEIQSKIYYIRGENVILDYDLAQLISFNPEDLYKKIISNRNILPDDFIFSLNQQELTALRKHEINSLAIDPNRQSLPFAFTEHGIALLTPVLTDAVALQKNISIIRAFVMLRKYYAAQNEIMIKLSQHDYQIAEILNFLKQLEHLRIKPKPETRTAIGFDLDGDGIAGGNVFNKKKADKTSDLSSDYVTKTEE